MTLLLAGLFATPCHAEFRDPTQPGYPLPSATTDAGTDIELVLSSIWISSKSRRATINGVSAKQGQTIIVSQAPPLAATIDGSKPAQALDQTNTDQQSSNITTIPTASTTIKIISIHNNSVIIDQNGERKTLELVQRPYKTQLRPNH
jgi:hypothetical protein